MTPTSTEIRQTFAGLASYESFLNKDPYYYEATKWHRRLRKNRLKCRPFSLRQKGENLFVLHETQSEILATRMSVDLTPKHDEEPDNGLFQHLYDHNILTYDRRRLEQIELNSEVAERLCALIVFEAGEDLQAALSALEVRRHALAIRDWGEISFCLDNGAAQ